LRRSNLNEIATPSCGRLAMTERFESFSVIARSETTKQSRRLSTSCEIASSAKALWRTRNDNMGILQRSQNLSFCYSAKGQKISD